MSTYNDHISVPSPVAGQQLNSPVCIEGGQDVVPSDHDPADPAPQTESEADLKDPLEGTNNIRHQFSQVFSTRKEYEEYIGTYDANSADPSHTVSDQSLRPWVKKLFEAFVNTRGVKIRDKAGYAVTRLGGQHFKALLIHLKCWEIVVKTLKITKDEPIIKAELYNNDIAKIGYTNFGSWEERLEAIVKVVKVNKMACHMMLQADPTDKIIQDPTGENKKRQEYSERNDQRKNRYNNVKEELLNARNLKRERDTEDSNEEATQALNETNRPDMRLAKRKTRAGAQRRSDAIVTEVNRTEFSSNDSPSAPEISAHIPEGRNQSVNFPNDNNVSALAGSGRDLVQQRGIYDGGSSPSNGDTILLPGNAVGNNQRHESFDMHRNQAFGSPHAGPPRARQAIAPAPQGLRGLETSEQISIRYRRSICNLLRIDFAQVSGMPLYILRIYAQTYLMVNYYRRWHMPAVFSSNDPIEVFGLAVSHGELSFDHFAQLDPRLGHIARLRGDSFTIDNLTPYGNQTNLLNTPLDVEARTALGIIANPFGRFLEDDFDTRY